MKFINVDDFDFKTALTIKETFINTNKYIEKYGEKTIVLTQIGSFYEVYSIQLIDDEDEEYLGSNIVEHSKMCDLNIANKNIKITSIKTNKKYQVNMAGFGMVQLEKYVKRIQSFNYTVVVISQDSMGEKNPTRSVTGIFSPGTCFQEESLNETENLYNSIVSIWLEHDKNNITIGASCIDIYTGKCSLFEYSTNYIKRPTTYDELEKFISISKPIEAIIISPMNDNEINNIISYINLKCKVHIIENSGKTAKNCEKQVYQKELLSKYYEFENFSIFNKNFYQHIIATQSFCYLLDFINEHDKNLIKNLNEPIFENIGSKVLLANYSLRQLNILDDMNNIENKNPPLCKMLNNCITSEGKRHFNCSLLNPITDEIFLNKEYNITEHLINKDIVFKKKIASFLKKIKDTEKLIRFIFIGRILAKDIYTLYKNLENILLIYEEIKNDSILIKYLNDIDSIINEEEIFSFQNFLENTFNLEICKNTKKYSDFPENILKPECNDELFEMLKNNMESYDKLEKCKDFLNEVIGNNFIKINETEKNHTLTLLCTIIRSKILEKKLEGMENKKIKLKYISSFDQKEKKFTFNFEDLSFQKTTNTNNSIISNDILELCSISSNIKIELNDLINKIYNDSIKKLQNYKKLLNKSSNFITILDFILCKANIATTFNYCKPVIQASENSFLNAKNIRHPIIECIIDEFYVPNDVSIGSNGILLYGSNSAGKSSIVKAIGLTVILAQAGFYVPCSEFVYYPYKKIFSRILNNDNLHEGLSSFVVEMIEIETILKYADNRSLILGNEPCSTTEINDAKNIVIATLEHLSNSNSTFIFASHIFEILPYEEVKSMVKSEKLFIKHLSVIYDKISKKLIYNRKLLEGEGLRNYAFEVCTYLNMTPNFLERVKFLRTKYSNNESILNHDISKYNKEKIKNGICEECKNEMGTEIHHKFLQKDADSNGFITLGDGTTFHKNHPKNLLRVCEDCHKKFHKKKSRLVF